MLEPIAQQDPIEEATSWLLLRSVCGALTTLEKTAASILPQFTQPARMRHDLQPSLTRHLYRVALDVTASNRCVIQSVKDHVVSHGRKLLFPTHTAFQPTTATASRGAADVRIPAHVTTCQQTVTRSQWSETSMSRIVMDKKTECRAKS